MSFLRGHYAKWSALYGGASKAIRSELDLSGRFCSMINSDDAEDGWTINRVFSTIVGFEFFVRMVWILSSRQIPKRCLIVRANEKNCTMFTFMLVQIESKCCWIRDDFISQIYDSDLNDFSNFDFSCQQLLVINIIVISKIYNYW